MAASAASDAAAGANCRRVMVMTFSFLFLLPEIT